MKTIMRILVLICLLVSQTGMAQYRQVSLDEALAVAKSLFKGRDVDYYQYELGVTQILPPSVIDTLITDIEPNRIGTIKDKYWSIFVDADPLAGWEHEAYMIRVPKTTNLDTPTYSESCLRCPPQGGSLIELSVKNRYGANALDKPMVKKVNTPGNGQQGVSDHTYALIISGGWTKFTNYERYWNDCSFVYQTLVNKYMVPKSHIDVLMADGTDPASDMRGVDGTYKSSPLDLDFDGKADINYSATSANISACLNALSSKLTADDHLFIYVIDHGGSDDEINSSYICLWNQEKLYDTRLAEMLAPITAKKVNVNVVLGQCYAGGFIGELSQVGCVVAAACKGSENSYACPSIPYDEFVYHWTSAVNGADSKGLSVVSDSDGNGHVTMKEAFDYAAENDYWKIWETPQYSSIPTSLGDDLAFDYIPESFDLYMRDNVNDTGIEPNITTDIFYNSPDIWTRNENDGIEAHEMPLDGQTQAFVYVRVKNRGKMAYNSNVAKRYLHVYWAQASTYIERKTWYGDDYLDDYQMGGLISKFLIRGEIAPGEEMILPLAWTLPRELWVESEYKDDNMRHFCLVAHITETLKDESYDEDAEWQTYPVRQSNDAVQKNLMILSSQEASEGVNVIVRNILDGDAVYSLELRPNVELAGEMANKTTSIPRVEMQIPKTIYKSWMNGGEVSDGFDYSSGPGGTHTMIMTGYENRLANISMSAKQTDMVRIRVTFSSTVSTDELYAFDLIQRDEDGNIVGGEAFIVKKPVAAQNPVKIVANETDHGKYVLTTDTDVEGYSVKWYDMDDHEIGSGESIEIAASESSKTFRMRAISPSDELSVDAVTLKSDCGIKSMDSTDGVLRICLDSATDSGEAMVRIVSASNPQTGVTERRIPIGSDEIQVDIKHLLPGVYVVSYISDGVSVDTVKFMK